jgi:hypothetical protein
MNDVYYELTQRLQEQALIKFLTRIEKAPAPYEDRDEVVLNAFSDLSERERINVIQALTFRL